MNDTPFCIVKMISDNEYYFCDCSSDVDIGDVVEVLDINEIEEVGKGIVINKGENRWYRYYRAKQLADMKECFQRSGAFILSNDGKILFGYNRQAKDFPDFRDVDYNTTLHVNEDTRDDESVIKIPEGIEVICSYAFVTMATLKDVILPKSLKKLEARAFSGTNMTSIDIPSGVEFIGRMPDIKPTFPDGNPRFFLDGKCLYHLNDDDTQDLIYCYKTGIDHIDIPERTVRICENAFAGCYRLTKVNLNKGLRFIEVNAFHNGSDNLKSIRIPDTVEDFSNLSHRRYAMNRYGSTSRISIELDASNPYYTLDGNALYHVITNGNYRLESVIRSDVNSFSVMNGTTIIGEYAIKCGCPKVILPKTLEHIEKYAFCPGIKTITTDVNDSDWLIRLPDTMMTIEPFAFSRTTFKKVVICPPIKKIARYAFYGIKELEAVMLPETIERLGIFEDESLEDDPKAVFAGTRLRKIEAPKDCKMFSSLKGVLYNRDKTKLIYVPERYPERVFVVPDSVKDIGRAFVGCEEIWHVVLPESVSSIGGQAFCNSAVKTVVITNPATNIDALAFEKRESNSVLIIAPAGSEAEKFCADNDVAKFKPLEQLNKYDNFETEIDYKIIGDEISIIGYSGKSASLVIPEKIMGMTVTSFDKLDDKSRKKITKIIMPNSIKRLGKSLFSSCKKLSFVKLPEYLKSIPSYAFDSCIKLRNIEIPDSVVEIGESAFRGTGLTSIRLPSNLKRLSRCWISDCSNLMELVLSENIEALDEGSLAGLGVKQIVFPKALGPKEN